MPVILVGEKYGATVVAAQDDVQRLLGQKISARPGHRGFHQTLCQGSRIRIGAGISTLTPILHFAPAF